MAARQAAALLLGAVLLVAPAAVRNRVVSGEWVVLTSHGGLNFYIGNAAVIVPTFNDPNDRKALGILAELFRDRPVVGIHAVDLVLGFGTLHCLTQQQPKG